MDNREQVLIESYIYEVTKRVAREQREEISMELKELISDMQESEGIGVEAVLQKLGNPREFAKKYRDDSNYLISPEYYDNYIWVLKIVMISVLISAVASTIFRCFAGMEMEFQTVGGVVDNITRFFTVAISEMITDLCISAIGAFGCVTLIFAILERQKVKVELKKEEAWKVGDLDNKEAQKAVWTPKQLSPVPNKKGLIKRSDSIVSIIVITFLGGLLIFAPYVFGVFVLKGEETKQLSIFNMEYWNMILPLLLISLFAGLLSEIIRLVTGCYCKIVMISTIILEVLKLILAAIALKLLPIWNPNFILELSENYDIKIASKGDLLYYWGTDFFSNIILAIIVVATCIEIGVTVYKTCKYSY